MTVGESRSLMYKMLDNLDRYQDERRLLLIDGPENRNDYKGEYTSVFKKGMINANSTKYN